MTLPAKAGIQTQHHITPPNPHERSKTTKKSIYKFYVYILTNKINGTLYIGLTNDIQRRLSEHKSKNIQRIYI